MKKRNIDRRISDYGGDIMRNNLFRRMFLQQHHMNSTSVGKHSVSTARMGLKLSDFFKRRGVEIDEKKVVRIALLHDLGMFDRKNAYKNKLECGLWHPSNSADAAKKVWKDIDKESLEAIRSHMWPLSLTMPHTKEAFILCLADKMASVKDLIPAKRRK